MIRYLAAGACIAVAALSLLPSSSYASEGPPPREPWDQAGCWPDRIIASPAKDATTGFAVNWRTSPDISEAITEITEATAAPRFDLGATSKGANYQAVDLEKSGIKFGREGTPNFGRGTVHYFTVQFKDLKPDTLYDYRVRGGQGCWSEWFQLRTAPAQGPLSFLYMGDAQYGIRSHWSHTLRQAVRAAPKAAFIAYAGDLVNQGDRDAEWAEWFEAGKVINGTVPVIPASGNHDYNATAKQAVRDGHGIINDFWRPQFALPVERDLPEQLRETVYDVRYGANLHMFVLDSSSPDWDVQMKWLATKAAASSATWKVVLLHHSPFRPGIIGREYHEKRQRAFVEAAKRAGISVILAGHNHSYSRASFGDGVGPGVPDPAAAQTLIKPRKVEMEIVISASGGMSGKLNAKKFAKGTANFGNRIALERWANNTPTYQVVDVDADHFRMTTYTTLGEIYDAFSLDRDAHGEIILTNGKEAFGPVRSFENTEPYGSRDDLH